MARKTRHRYRIYFKPFNNLTDQLLSTALPSENLHSDLVVAGDRRLLGVWEADQGVADQILAMLEDNPDTQWDYFRQKERGIIRRIDGNSRPPQVRRAG